VAAGANHTLAYVQQTDPDTFEITASVICWGNSCANSVPAELKNIDVSVYTVTDIVAQGNHNAALLSDGSIIEWYTTGNKQTHVPEAGETYTRISIGNTFLMALVGVAHTLEEPTETPTAIPTPEEASPTATPEPTPEQPLRAFGDPAVNTLGQLNIPSGVTCWSEFSAGANHVVAIDCTGQVYAWGDGSKKQTTIPRDFPRSIGALLCCTRLSLIMS
jgi:alpha-tubulin suppressor-like RCC1 family protein